MDEERDAFYIVRKGDMVSIYKTLSDCQAQVSSSVRDPSVSVYKGYSLRKETEEYLASRGFKNPLYTIDASDLKEDLFGTIVPCPFQQPDGLAFVVDKTSKKLSPQKRSKEVEAVGSSLLSTEQKHLKPGFTIEAQPIRCRYNTVKPSQDACWEENEKLKAIWDDSATDIFMKICVSETLAGNRPNGHFSKLGWKNVINKFNDMTGRPYQYKQLKNKWTSLKKDWQIWTALVGNETDLGWDLSRQTIDASNEWWDKKSKEIPEAIKFRTKGLKNVDQLDFLFKHTVVTGEGAWAHSQGLVAHDIEDDPSMMGGHDDNLTEAQWNLGFDVETKDNLENIVTNVETSTPTTGAPTQGRGKKRKKVGLRAGVTTKLSQKLDRICEAVESRTSDTSRMTVKPGCSIAEVMELLRNIPEVVDDVELYMKATDIFLKRENREMFLALQKPDIQIAWLKRQKMSCTIEFDGASKGNPGKAGAGVILRAEDGSVICRLRQGLGVVTNNVAEYRALILGLQYALKKGYKQIFARGDSQLVCMQVQGLWQTKNQNMSDLCKVVKELKDMFVSFEINHVKREFNSDADAQANLAIDLLCGEVYEERGQ